LDSANSPWRSLLAFLHASQCTCLIIALWPFRRTALKFVTLLALRQVLVGPFANG
jgi:hypothetical protein